MVFFIFFILCTSTGFSFPHHQTLWFAGFDLSLMGVASQDSHSFNVRIPGALDVLFDQSSLKIKDTSPAGGIAIGFVTLSSSFLWGIEARASLENIRTLFNVVTTEANSTLIASNNVVVKLKNDFALPFKVGITCGSDTLFYVITGFEYAHFNVSTSGSFTTLLGGPGGPLAIGDTQKALSRYKAGWLAGIGMEHLLSQFSIGLEYNYSYYGKLAFPQFVSGPLDTSGFTTDAGLIHHNKITAKMNQTMLKFIYYFS